jgi:cell division protein FtsB
MRNFALVLVVLLGALQYKLWAGDGGIFQVISLKREIARQREENAQLAERNKALGAEVHDLRTGLSALEERARIELGMIRKDETFFQVVNPDE